MTATTAEIPVERDAADRQRRLASAVRTLRTRAGGADGARLLLIAGGVLIPLGFIVILLGWYGASHTVNLWEQIPYSISGGTLGLGLVFAGGFSYFATPTGTMYHRADCPAVAGRDNLREVSGTEDGLTACRICEPA